MAINFGNIFTLHSKSKLGDFQDLDHLDGVSISTISANLYNSQRDYLVMFYFISIFKISNINLFDEMIFNGYGKCNLYI